jgi:predicted RNase H-like HicB family nuclease
MFLKNYNENMAKKVIKAKEYSFTVIYELVKEGGYKATVPSLPGLITYGRDFEEARKMVREAILCHIEALAKEGKEIPKERGLIQEKVVVRL